MMKAYAFVRTNAPRVLNYNPSIEKESVAEFDENTNILNDNANEIRGPCPSFSCYLYFLFVPTLVYRDEYPR
jgi:sterol O-acyltransferase